MYQLTASTSIIRTTDSACIPADLANSDYSAYLAWVAEGNTPEPYIAPPVDIQALVVTATQQRLDDFAKTRNYDGILSACTYAGSLIPQFKSDGLYCCTMRDATWAALYTFMAEVQAGTQAMPNSFADVEPLLPVLTWPA